MKIKLSAIHNSPYMLRDVVKDNDFLDLVSSINTQGLLQPIKVRPNNAGYELVYGHRRTAAMRQLGWDECEAIVETLSDEQAYTHSLVENIHRKDLEPIEEAKIFSDLYRRGYSQIQIAKLVSKSAQYISTRLNLLKLPIEVQQIVGIGERRNVPTSQQGGISIDAASQIATTVNSPVEAVQLAQKVLEEQLTRDQVRDLARSIKQSPSPLERQQMIERPFREIFREPDTAVTPPIETKFLSYGSKPFHTADRSVSDQFHSKWLWDLARINLQEYSHFTIGYSQRNWTQLLELLQIAKVTMLIDARRNAVSQYKPEFSKANLELQARDGGISYRHIPELGIGSEERGDLAETHDYESLFSTYQRRLDKTLLKSLLGDDLQNHRLAFMCVEIDPNTCHRNRIALLLEESGFSTLDL